MNKCETNCVCFDCTLAHRKHGCNFGAGDQFGEDYDECCDCPEIEELPKDMDKLINDIWP